MDLPSDAQPQAVIDLLAGFGFTVPESDIQIKPMARSGSRAAVRFDDPNSAKRVVKRFNETFGGDGGELSVKVVLPAAKFGSRLELCSVSCSWLRPARIARLYYFEFQGAVAGRQLLESRSQILGRKFTVTGPDLNDPTPTLQVTGLDPATEKVHFDEIFNPTVALNQIPVTSVMRRPASTLSDEESAEIVRNLLQDMGGLEYFGARGTTSNGRSLRAIASFTNRNAAIRAANELNGVRVRELGGCRLVVSRRVSVKYSIALQIAKAIQPQLDLLSKEIRATYNVLVEAYNHADRPFATIRVLGEAEKPVAHVNASIEKLIAGDVIMNGESALWDTSLSTEVLNKISSEKNVYIYRDTRKLQLRLFGGSSTTKPEIEAALIDAIATANKHIQSMLLDPEMLLKTTHGGLRRLREKFGNAVTLSRDGTLPSIVLCGSPKDLETVRNLILDDDASRRDESEAGECQICWCPAVEPLRLSCRHIYCRDCFFNAADSAITNPPFTCFGDNGTCSHIFGIEELRNIFPFTKFEKLLKDTFEMYVRTHPAELQFCPTPDCLSIYRPTDDGSIFACRHCLSHICTTCNVRAHDGLTCADWKKNHADGGTRALGKYKVEHDVRDCPSCKAAIEKDEGCMHMECGNCKAHICWFCMKYFETTDEGASGLCYAHMTNAHGGIYDPNDPNYVADSDSSDEEEDSSDEEDDDDEEGGEEGEGDVGTW